MLGVWVRSHFFPKHDPTPSSPSSQESQARGQQQSALHTKCAIPSIARFSSKKFSSKGQLFLEVHEKAVVRLVELEGGACRVRKARRRCFACGPRVEQLSGGCVGTRRWREEKHEALPLRLASSRCRTNCLRCRIANACFMGTGVCTKPKWNSDTCSLSARRCCCNPVPFRIF